jgi:DNA-binding beta-propeller fold protein YncE
MTSPRVSASSTDTMLRSFTSLTLAALLSLVSARAFATTIFVSNEEGNSVTVIESKTLKTIKTIPT